MSDSTDTPRERKPLGLKRSIDAGEVKQTFSHGRTNKVVVEVKRRRLVGKPGEAAPPPPVEAAPPPPPPPPPPAAPVAKKPASSSETPQERVARLQREAEGSGETGVVLPLDRAALSVAMGRDNVVHMALADPAAAARVSLALSRLMHFTGPLPVAADGGGSRPAALDD